MHEYDVNERKEEPASLPLPSSDTSDRNRNRSTSTSDTPSSQHTLHLQTHQEGTHQDQDQQEQRHQPQQDQQEQRIESVALFPQVLELVDRVVVANQEDVQIKEPQKKGRKRRVYVASSTRCASLRSQHKPPPGAAKDVAEGEVKPRSPSPLPPAQAAASPTPTEHFEYIKPEHFTPEFWNSIEEQEPERKPAGKKRRGAGGGRTRTRRNQILSELEIYSPETAAAIAAAQAELDATGKSTGGSRASRKRTHTATTTTTTTMSLYDRRYQSTTDERRVANGYGGNNALRAGTGPGSASTTSEIADSQELSQSSHQYYGSAGGSNPTGAGSGLNGSASAALNHAPSMGTLCNIGNTCYLNSVVYTLRFAPHFLHNLHHLIQDLTVVQQTIVRQQQASKSASLGRNVSVAQLEHARSWSSKDLVTSTDQQQYSGLNGGGSSAVSSASSAPNASGSSKSSHQSVTENLHELYNNLHGNEMADSTEPYHADTLLHAIQDVNATFEGNQQQDAHEFLMCVLNCIRETNQSLIKAIGECPEVIANGYIANPDEVDSAEGQDRTDSAAISGNNGSLVSTSHITTTKTSFFSRKSKRKDEVKSSKSTRIQSPLKDKDNSPTAAGGISGAGHATANSLFYLNTVDLTGGGGTPTASVGLPPAMPQPMKYSSDDDTNSATLLKDKMRLEERIRELNLNFFSSDFEGIVVLTTKCLSCETVTRQKQGMLDISVPVPISGYDNELQDKPSTYIQNSCMTKEYFRGENKYSCNQCTGYTEAIRSISYEVLPRLLVIQLNRFSGGMEKVSTYVPTTFTLPCFCAKCCDLAEGNKLHVYKLYSVITHVGATLTVGHYIAYTCFLDLASDYVNCPKDRRNATMTGSQTIAAAAAASASNAENSAPNNGSSTPVAAAASALASSGSNLMKKMKFGRGKTSSSGDLSKNLKQLNGISSKTITNGIGKLSMNNTTCHGVQCCAMRLCCSSNSNSASCSDFSEESLQNGSNSNLSYGGSAASSYPTGYGSTGRGGVKANYAHGGSDPIWYMCDDDKIKAMSQREFEELLSPTRKITITPYLLFYARFDLQPPSKPGTSSTPPPPAPPSASTSSQGSSWSNDNKI